MTNKIAFIINTPYGDCYETDVNGYVLRCNNGLNKLNALKRDLKTWQINGIREILPFGILGRLIPLSEAVLLTNFSFKNRNPKYVICDIDHGTFRIHGNSKYHGVRNIRKIDN